jgi:hypothetical protein
LVGFGVLWVGDGGRCSMRRKKERKVEYIEEYLSFFLGWGACNKLLHGACGGYTYTAVR